MIYEDAVLVSKKTGEVIGDYSDKVLYVQTKEERDQARKYVTDNKKLFTMEKKYESMGNFVWNIHNSGEVLCPEIRPTSLTRLMYLSTFLCYDGYLKDGKTNIHKNMLGQYLGLERRQQYRFWNEMSVAGMMYELDGKIYLNPEMFTKGTIKKSKIKTLAGQGKYVTRIYTEPLRNLYASFGEQSIKRISNLFKIMPYVNREYNLCCFNPLETDITDIHTMNFGDFVEALGYNRADSCKVANPLREAVFQIGDAEEKIIKYIPKKDSPFGKCGIIINPHLYYAGSDWSNIEKFCKF